ncbi:hypothetical protein FACS1894132_06180 [Clostridia bacterium]|nr:hypothetical protein FACS1894132_06180 [Clostridia bacterium]
MYNAKDVNVNYEHELNLQLSKLQKYRQKYMDMYTDDLISHEELNKKTAVISRFLFFDLF